MKNYEDDYRLEDQEAKAMAKSRNAKIAALSAAGVLGVGGTAFAATQLADGETDDPLTADDILSGAEASVEDIQEAPAEKAEHDHHVVETEQVHHVHHVHHHDPVFIQEPVNPEPVMDVDMQETSAFYDSEGNLVGVVDSGKINGTDVAFFDKDLNGKADEVWIDENNNHIMEEHEIHRMDNQSWDMGMGKEVHAYMQDESGNIVQVDNMLHQEHMADNDPGPGSTNIDEINNDFRDEKTGEYYRDDYAQNNPDYNNHGGEQYSAGVDHHNSQSEAMYDDSLAYNEPSSTDTGMYVEPAPETHHEVASYEAPVHETPAYEAPSYDAPTDHVADYSTDTHSDAGMDFSAGVDDMSFDA